MSAAKNLRMHAQGNTTRKKGGSLAAPPLGVTPLPSRPPVLRRLVHACAVSSAGAGRWLWQPYSALSGEQDKGDHLQIFRTGIENAVDFAVITDGHITGFDKHFCAVVIIGSLPFEHVINFKLSAVLVAADSPD